MRITEIITEAVHPDITSNKYFLDPTENVRMGDFEFNARTFTGALGDPNARGLQIRAYDPDLPKGSVSIGSADFIVKSDKKGNQWLESDDTEVNDEYRGKGVAAMMYAFAKSLGNDIKDSPYKSNAGAKMWSKWGKDAEHLIKESLSKVAFHYTNVVRALKILQSGEFQLSSTLGSVEQQYAPKNKPFFLSTTRTRQGGYHDFVGSSAVLFVLDGDWFNRHYVSKPVDYWENRDPSKLSHRKHEAEDRVFSGDPSIPVDGVTAIHLYVDPEAEPEIKAWARKTLLAAKQRNIATHFYTDQTVWRNFDSRKQADVDVLKGQERTGGYVSTHRGYLMPWMEIIGSSDKTKLSKKADQIRYNLMSDYGKEQVLQSLSVDLSNARKPDSGPDRDHAVKIISYMRKNNLNSIRDLVNALASKWHPQ